MTLENLLGRTVDRVEPDAAAIARLLDAVRISVADACLPQLSQEGRFDMAYKAIMQLANAALQANGYRTLTSRPGHHQTMIQTLPLTVGLDNAGMILPDQMRKQRNLVDYSGDLVSSTMADEAVRQAEALHDCVIRWIRANRPDLLDK